MGGREPFDSLRSLRAGSPSNFESGTQEIRKISVREDASASLFCSVRIVTAGPVYFVLFMELVGRGVAGTSEL